MSDTEVERFETYSESDHLNQFDADFELEMDEDRPTIESRLRLPRRPKRKIARG